MRSFFTREYEEAIKKGSLEYQKTLLTSELRILRERQRTIRRAVERAEREGVSRIIIDIATETEYQQNKKYIETLEAVRAQTAQKIKMNKKGIDAPAVQTFKALHVGQRLDVRKTQEAGMKASERTLSASIQRSTSEAVEEVIRRMVYTGNFMLTPFMTMNSIEQDYAWVFDILGFRLSDKFRQDIAKNYADYSSNDAYAFFDKEIDSILVVPVFKNEEDEKKAYSGHTKQEFEKALEDIKIRLQGGI